MAKGRLTDKQKLFAAAYIETLNATESARRAGYQGDDNTLGVIGHENLRKPKIKALIDEYLNAHAMSAAEVLYHLTDIARGDIGMYLGKSGRPDLSSLISDESPVGGRKTRLIKKVRTKNLVKDKEAVEEIEIELYDRLKALDLLAKYHQLTTTTRVEVSFEDQVIEAIRTGAVTFEALAEEFDEDLATQFFTTAGVPVQTE
jgi:phage terminase small subunit